ncbi:hypothetical protein Tco_1409010 [Tanacetum coccineum]
MTVHDNLPEPVRTAQVEACKKENIRAEIFLGEGKPFEVRSDGDIRLANDIVQPLSSRVPNQGHQSGLHENSTVSLTDFAYAKCSSQCALSNNSTRAGTYKSQTTTHHRVPYTHASHRQPIRSEDSNT